MKAESLCIVLMLMNAFQVPTEAQYDTLATGDSLQAWALNHEAHRAWDNNEPDKALFLAQSSIQLFYDDIALAADNYHLVAKLYARKNSTEDAIRYYLRSITAYEKLSDAPRLRNIYTETGDYYFSIGAYVKAPEYYLKASQLADEKEKNKLLIRVGDCYVRSGETAKSSEVYTEVLKNLPDTSQRSRLEILSHLSRNSSQQNSFDEALAYDREILEIFVHLFDTAGISAAYNNIAFDYVNLEKYPDAIGYFNQSLEFGKEQDKGSAEYVQLLINMGVCYQRGNDYDNALQYLLKAYELTGNNPGLSRQRADLENILAITYFYENNLKCFVKGAFNMDYFIRGIYQSYYQKRIFSLCGCMARYLRLRQLISSTLLILLGLGVITSE